MGNIYSELLELLFENKKYPYYAAERRLDLFINFFLEDILTTYYKEPVEYVVSEFPIKNSSSNMAFCVDYLCILRKQEKLLFVELKTDKKSLRDIQDERYLELVKRDWKSIFNDLKEKYYKVKVSDYRLKYYVLLKRLIQKNILTVNIQGDVFNYLDSVVGKDLDIKNKGERTKAIKKLWDSAEPVNMKTELLYILPDETKLILKDSKQKLLRFSELKSLNIASPYTEEYKDLIKKLQMN